MEIIYYNNTPVLTTTPVTGTSTSVYIYRPNYEILVGWSAREEVFDWVRNTCTGGFQVSDSYYGKASVKLVSKHDYLQFLLRWPEIIREHRAI